MKVAVDHPELVRTSLSFTNYRQLIVDNTPNRAQLTCWWSDAKFGQLVPNELQSLFIGTDCVERAIAAAKKVGYLK